MRNLLHVCSGLASLVLLALAVQGLAQVTSLPAESSPQAQVSGRVTLSDTHGPARNAAILLLSLNAQHRDFQRVAVDGTYRFEHVPPDEYIVVAYLDGYLSAFDKLSGTPIDETLGDQFAKIVAAQGSIKVGPQGNQTFDIMLEQGATISGRAMYADGAPAIQVGIELQNTAVPPPTADNGSVQLGDIARSEFVHRNPETDDQGFFRVAGIPPGTYRVAAFQLSKVPAAGYESVFRVIQGAVRFYAGDTVHPKLAKTFSLAAGQEVKGLELRIPIDGLYSVQGDVTSNDGRPITSVGVQVTDRSDPSLYFLAPAPEGHFLLERLPPGTYTVTAPYGNNPAKGGVAAAAFGPGSTSFTIKDRNVTGVVLTLPNAALPASPNAPVR